MGSVFLLLIAVVFACCTPTQSLPSKNLPSLKGHTYTYLGTGSSNGGTESRAGIEYYVFHHGLPQNSSLAECSSMGGELLSILNPKQDNEIQTLLLQQNLSHGTFWTSGSYDPELRQWVWQTNKRIVNYSNFRNSASNPNLLVGITIGGHLSLYGWNTPSNQCAYPYICMF